MASENKKQVKVQGKFRPSQSRCMGATGKNVPWLNLSGIWLEEAGFNIGDLVRVVSRSGLLLIERIEFSGLPNVFRTNFLKPPFYLYSLI
ncbi:SymE family type I addiction module toxin [Sphingobacterium sp. Mn56C]|uniref:SymE family type I addiction module toxin n=1 Tax=Sphingobacterium sp. Mn56C TaxID=3395261 RepID=UPI003BE2120F